MDEKEALSRIKKIFEEKGEYELPTDSILSEFDEFIANEELSDEEYKRRINFLKAQVKKIAFFDKSERVWILRD